MKKHPVIPGKAGTSAHPSSLFRHEAPAFAGVTEFTCAF
jgi:hypothetical protein